MDTADYLKTTYPTIYSPPFLIKDNIEVEGKTGYLYWMFRENRDILQENAPYYFILASKSSNYGAFLFFLNEFHLLPGIFGNGALLHTGSQDIMDSLLKHPDFDPNKGDVLLSVIEQGDYYKVDLILNHPKIKIKQSHIKAAIKESTSALQLLLNSDKSNDSLNDRYIEQLVSKRNKLEVTELFIQHPLFKDNEVLRKLHKDQVAELVYPPIQDYY